MTETKQRKLKVGWADDASTEVTSAPELDALLDRLDRRAREGEPFIASLEHATGPVLSIGLGRDGSVLNYSASLDPPYFTSHNPDGDQDATTAFYYYGAWSEFGGDQVVPMEEARQAARHFLAGGERPENIEWAMD